MDDAPTLCDLCVFMNVKHDVANFTACTVDQSDGSIIHGIAAYSNSRFSYQFKLVRIASTVSF